jgi:hypothetical protein
MASWSQVGVLRPERLHGVGPGRKELTEGERETSTHFTDEIP